METDKKKTFSERRAEAAAKAEFARLAVNNELRTELAWLGSLQRVYFLGDYYIAEMILKEKFKGELGFFVKNKLNVKSYTEYYATLPLALLAVAQGMINNSSPNEAVFYAEKVLIKGPNEI